MIIKSKGASIKAVKKILTYILREEAQFIDSAGNRPFVTQHIRGNSIDEWVQEFTSNEAKRKTKHKHARGLYHCILSFHPKDSSQVTVEILNDIARQFIHMRCPDSLVVGAAHYDDHIHVHLVISGVVFGSSGKSIRMSREEFKDALKSLEVYQEMKYPQLENSVVDFEKGKRSKDNEYQMRLNGKVPEKHLVEAYAKAALETSSTFDEFLSTLNEQGFSPYKRNGKIIGVQGKRKYRLKTLNINLQKFKERERNFEL